MKHGICENVSVSNVNESVWAWQLCRLPCLVLYVKYQFFRLAVCCLSPAMVTYHHEVSSILLREVGWESVSFSALMDPLMSSTHWPKETAKPDWAKQLTRLPCLVVYAKFLFFIYSYSQNWQSALAGFNNFQGPIWTGFWEGIQWVPRDKQSLPLCRLASTCFKYTT